MNMLSDRLVGADLELRSGPKDPHKGPIRLEILLSSEEELSLFKDSYLPKLSGLLPIVSKVKVPKSIDSGDSGSREKLIEYLSTIPSQEEAIKYLRKLGFMFIAVDYAEDMKIFSENSKSLDIMREDNGRLCYMINRLKVSKTDPALDKFDPKLLFGFNLDSPDFGIKVILFDEVSKIEGIGWKNSKPIKPKFEFAKFPKYMVEEERLKFSKELRLLRDNPEREPSKFFKRWMHDVSFHDKDTILDRSFLEVVKKPKPVKKVKKLLQKR